MLNLNSLHRRRERYCIIYLWKILEGLVPNFSDPIVRSFSDRRGRSCIVSHVNPGRRGTLAFNNFRWRSVRIFNRLPIHIRNISACSIDRLVLLRMIPRRKKFFFFFKIRFRKFFLYLVCSRYHTTIKTLYPTFGCLLCTGCVAEYKNNYNEDSYVYEMNKAVLLDINRALYKQCIN